MFNQWVRLSGSSQSYVDWHEGGNSTCGVRQILTMGGFMAYWCGGLR